MRGTVQEVTRPTGFQPFKLVIDVESPADLKSLWARFNMSGPVLSETASRMAYQGKKGPFSPSFTADIAVDPEGKKEVYKILSKKMKDAGIARR